MKNQILIYSQYSNESKKLFQVLKKYNIDTSDIFLLNVDNENIRLKIMNDKKLNIRSVPTLVFIKDPKKGIIEKYVGYEKISELIEIPVKKPYIPSEPSVQQPSTPQSVQLPSSIPLQSSIPPPSVQLPSPVQQPPIPQPSVQQPPIPQPSVQQPPIPQPSVQQPPIPQPLTSQPPIPQPLTSQPPIPQPSVQQPPVQLPQPSVQQPLDKENVQVNQEIISREMPTEMNSISLQSNIDVSSSITDDKKDNLPVKPKNPVSDLATKMRQEREALDNEIGKNK